jgi:hypothetical protein
MEIEEIDVASMPPEERGSRAVLYEELRRVDCMTRISPGVTRGINAAFLKDARSFAACLTASPAGTSGGSSPSSFDARAPSARGQGKCARVRPRAHEHVKRSVFLALLCGTGATDIMRAVVAKYATDQGLMITLDSLTHVIPYYLRPEFGVARTEASFARSGVIQRAYRRASTRDERRACRTRS